jgi:glutamate-ammonia-ligase adenylyltransferase
MSRTRPSRSARPPKAPARTPAGVRVSRSRVSRSDVRSLLLAPDLGPEAVAKVLKPYGLADVRRADANLQAMAGEPRSRELLASILPALLREIGSTADPDQALDHWEQFLQQVNRAQLFGYLSSIPRLVHLLCAIFGNSPFLASTLVRDPLLVYWLAEEDVLSKGAFRLELDRALRAILANLTVTEVKLEALRRFKRREMLRIGVRDLLRLADVAETTAALSDLAGVLIQTAYEVVDEDLRRRYGAPTHQDRSGKSVETGFAVMAMGKLGGHELNYSSDVDLLYVYADEGNTLPSRQPSVLRHAQDAEPGRGAISHQRSIPNEEYFEYLARDLTRALSEPTQEGYVFRVDLRLRPEGSVGPLARSLADYERYYTMRGRPWERLALLKAWPVAGSGEVGRRFLQAVQPFIFWSNGSPAGAEAAGLLREVKAIKGLIDERMAERGHDRRNVKLGIGGIREVEFVVQALQVLLGRRIPDICERNTLSALSKLADLRLLSRPDARALAGAYAFLRDVEHKLQMVHDLQTHALPVTVEEIRKCALRLGYPRRGRRDPSAVLLADHRRHTDRVNRIFRRLFDPSPRGTFLTPDARRLIGSR